jgi:hypothetical protein
VSFFWPSFGCFGLRHDAALPCLHLNHQAASHRTAARQGDAHSNILHRRNPWLRKLPLPAEGCCGLRCSKEGAAPHWC